MFSIKDNSRINKQRGFSLVELMITVSLIGILAVIGIPSYSKFRVKAYQSEAKSQLSALYVAEKSFYLQYESYHSSLTAVGYMPAGRTRYNIGFGAFDGTVTTDYAIPPSAYMNTKMICTGAGGIGTDSRCEMIMETPNIQLTAVVSQHSFVASAVSYEDLMLAQNFQANPNLINFAHLVILGVTPPAQAIPPGGTKCTHRSDSGVDAWNIDENKKLLSTKISATSYQGSKAIFNYYGCEPPP